MSRLVEIGFAPSSYQQNGNMAEDEDSDLSENEDFPMEALFSDDNATPSSPTRREDGRKYVATDDESDSDEFPASPRPMTLRQRRLSKSALPRMPSLNFAKKSAPIRISDSSSSPSSSPRLNWKRAFQKLKKLRDPWAEFHIDSYQPETAIRHRYNALKKIWVTDTVCIKMEKTAFNHGAMRECYRLKKQSNFSNRKGWKHAQNYVAKIYMQEVPREVYFEDVRLQMDAKLWGEEYNRHNPPKKVDIFQLSILEFMNREGEPLYHLEHYIEGEYIKYNSNSGFVDEKMRLTPHAFSHFTFERSGHELIVVDIQGVGDLYTDPQIHTSEGNEYGDGNLGTRGMALFFHSHVCNTICQSLQLSQFDLASHEIQDQQKFMNKNAMTVVRGCEEMCLSPSPKEKIDLSKFIRQRTISQSSALSADESASPLDSENDNDEVPAFFPFKRRLNLRFISESDRDTVTESSTCPDDDDDDDDIKDDDKEEEDRIAFRNAMRSKHRPSCIAHEIRLRSASAISTDSSKVVVQFDSVLGNIHHDLAKYHEAGRFVMNDAEIDWDAALFHEEHAAQLGVMDAIITMARLYLGLPRDVLINCEVQTTDENISIGLHYMEKAAEGGDRGSMIFLAKSFETGENVGGPSFRNWNKAVSWYEKAVTYMDNDQSGQFDGTLDNPIHILQAKLAEMLRRGGNGLIADPNKSGELYTSAADSATAAMNGKLAAKYYMLAEEAWAECEEEDEEE
ncbi:eukaryotic elongation factor 2 kinase-like isoform X2 [Tubulanus polymorphus]|uniref:eukaryotic elongation factor 2 kinase-like isoform X2 n=1 Tax=Tubulanus polymorphus TaxID=672921 RepID=UPI003DA66EA4